MMNSFIIQTPLRVLRAILKILDPRNWWKLLFSWKNSNEEEHAGKPLRTGTTTHGAVMEESSGAHGAAHAMSFVGTEAFHANKFFVEAIKEGLFCVSTMKGMEFSGKSQFQEVDVIQLDSFGRTLVLDSKTQSSEFDEFAYHECLVHPALLTHPNPKRVFIGGGGEGATAREVLRHRSVEHCVMVDIDGLVVDLCRKYLPNHSAGAFDDSRLEFICDDAKAYLENTDSKFDVIILDLADPVDGGPCHTLYTAKFYEFLVSKLSPDGLLVTQAGPCGLMTFTEVFTRITATMMHVFPNTSFASTYIPSFADEYGYAIGSNARVPTDLSREEVDKVIGSRGLIGLRYLDGITWDRIFSLPLPIRKVIEEEKRPISEEDPAYIQ